jgi:hypothetical protein
MTGKVKPLALTALLAALLSSGCKRGTADSAGSTNSTGSEKKLLEAWNDPTTPEARAFINQTQRDSDAALSDATDKIRWAREFIQLFPGTQRHFSGYINSPELIMQTPLFERYELTMKLPITLDPSRKSIQGFSQPTFLLIEITNISKTIKTGSLGSVTNVGAQLNTQGQLRFGTNEWTKIVAAKGDFSAIGANLVTNQSIPFFSEWQTRSH